MCCAWLRIDLFHGSHCLAGRVVGGTIIKWVQHGADKTREQTVPLLLKTVAKTLMGPTCRDQLCFYLWRDAYENWKKKRAQRRALD